jgi:hypothetical protein
MSDGTIRHNGLCLDVARASKANGAKIDLWSCNGGANQQWVYKAGPNGNGRGVDSEIGVITNPVSGKVLNDARYGGDGTQQVLWTNVGTNNELWLTPICSIYTTPPC